MAALAGQALRHLHRRVVQPHDARPDLGDDRLWYHEELRLVEGVEALGDVAGQLYVLLLVLAHRHLVGVIEQDVPGH